MPLLIVLSGPSGAGKDTVLNRMKELDLHYHYVVHCHYVVTLTTRPRRPREKNGTDYHFTSEAEFQEMIQRGELLEWAKVYGNWYGVPKQQVKQALDRGEDVVMKLDVQGAATVKNLFPEAVLIFLTPPSIEEQARRLQQRESESTAELELRIKTTQEEIKYLPLFDYVVVNPQGEIDSAISQIKEIITTEKQRVNPRVIELK